MCIYGKLKCFNGYNTVPLTQSDIQETSEVHPDLYTNIFSVLVQVNFKDEKKPAVNWVQTEANQRIRTSSASVELLHQDCIFSAFEET